MCGVQVVWGVPEANVVHCVVVLCVCVCVGRRKGLEGFALFLCVRSGAQHFPPTSSSLLAYSKLRNPISHSLLPLIRFIRSLFFIDVSHEMDVG